MVLHRSLSDNKSPQVSRTLLSILADLNNAVTWMVSVRPLISKFPSPFTNSLGIVPSAPITINITITFMFHSLFSSQARSRYSSLFLLLILLSGPLGWQSLLFGSFSFFWSTITRFGCLAEIMWSVCISKSQRTLCVSFFRMDLGYVYTTCSYGQISISCTISSGSPCLPSHV